MDVRLILAGVFGLVAILAAYVVLVALGHGDDANGLAPLVITLLGFVGLGAHTTQRLGKQDETLEQQTEQLDQITHQTNGVLTARIKAATDEAVRTALRSAGYHVPDGPASEPPELSEVPGQ